jgi:hypothetical protein
MPTAPERWRSDILVNSTATAGLQAQSDVTGLANDFSVVVWHDFATNDVLAQRYDPFGVAVGAVITVNNGSPTTEPSLPRVAALADGGFVVTYTKQLSATDFDIYSQRYAADGTGGALTFVATPGGLQTYSDVVGLTGGGYVVTWADYTVGNGNVLATIYNAAGGIVASNIQAAPFADTDVQSFPSITALTNGGFVIASTDTAGTRISVSVFTAAGVRTDASPTTYAGTTVSDSVNDLEPSVTALAGGGFIVAWRNEFSATDHDIYGQLYSAAGVAVGSQITLVSPIGFQQQPAVVGLPDGGFAIAYYDSQTTGGDISLRTFTSTGTGLGTITVNSLTTGFQNDVRATALDDGRILVSWTDSNGVGGGDIHSQIVDARPLQTNSDSTGETLVGHDTGQSNTNDILVGNGGNDNLYGLAGNDFGYGGTGNDVFIGGDGVDVGVLGDNNDYGYGGNGSDYMFGGNNDDVLLGDAGVDVLYGDDGADSLFGGTETDYLYGGAGIDTLYGGEGNDILYGDANSGDSIYGDNGQDYFYLGTGAATAYGGAGVDVFLGGAGNDTFYGGADVDYFYGGAGADTYVIRTGDSAEVIYDFAAGQDKINFQGTGLTSYADVVANMAYYGGINTTIVTAASSSTAVWFIGLAPGNLTAADFIFS